MHRPPPSWLIHAALACAASLGGCGCDESGGARADAGRFDGGGLDARPAPHDAGADSGAADTGTADSGPLACLHDPCQAGALLDSSCSPCAERVCATEEWCCFVRWEEGCVDIALANTDVCECAPETECDDLIDQDRDGRFDCDDEDCRAAGLCNTGTGTTGAPCTTSADCAATGEDPLCVDASRFEWPGGFCTELCDVAANDCPPGAECQDIGLGGGRGVCQVKCDRADPTCREGYECREDRGSGPFCQPNFEVCDNDADDDFDGRVDCAEWDCLHHEACVEICDNGVDDNRDGTIDCDDVRCVDATACAARVVAVCEGVPAPADSCVTLGAPGFPCDPITSAGCHPGQTCELAGGTFLCFGPPNDVPPCERCGGLRGRCAPGTTCMYLGSARCAHFCCDDADCGTDSSCNHAYVSTFLGRTDSPVGVCVRR